jgi:hypothetical protein
MTASLTLLKRAKPSSVLEQNDTFSFAQGMAHGIDQFYGKITLHFTALPGPKHIHNF